MTGPTEEHRRTHEAPAGGAATGSSIPPVTAPVEHHVTPPTGENPTLPSTMHKHEAPASGGAVTGPGMTGPAVNAPVEHHVTPPSGEAPATSSPMMHRHETPPVSAAPAAGTGVAAPERSLERHPAAAPVVQPVAPHAHPVEKAAPPPPSKPEDKDKKDKPPG